MDTDENTEQHEATAADAAPTGMSAEKRTAAEHWARAKGMLPQFIEGKKMPTARAGAPAPLVHNPKHALFHAAKHGKKWPIGMELTEAEFDAAVAETQGHVFR